VPLTFFGEIWPGQRVSYQNQFIRTAGTPAIIQVRQHTRFYHFETDTHTEQAQAILDQALNGTAPWGNILPQLGDIHPNDGQALAAYYNVAKNTESSFHGQVECAYLTGPDPTTLPAVVSYTSTTIQRAFEGAYAFVAADGSEDTPGLAGGHYPTLAPTDPYPITASNFRPFVPPPADQVPFRVLTVKKAMSTAAWAAWQASEKNFIQAINSVNWTVRGKTYSYNQVYMPQPPVAEETFQAARPPQVYYNTTWTFHVDEARGFHLKLADMGYYELAAPSDPSSGEREILLTTGRPTQPVRLNGTGQRLALGGATVFLTYRVRKKADFNSLPISPVT